MSRKTTPTYVLLNQITLAATSSSVTFSNIPQGYGDLVLIVNGRGDYSVNAFESLQCRLNSDSGSNYSYVIMSYQAGSSYSTAGTATSLWFGRLPNANGGNTNFGTNVVNIMDYSATDKHKTSISRSSNVQENLAPSADASRWANTAAVTSLTLTTGQSANFVVDSTFSLYGIVD
jgi:hypothetical protein